MEGKEIIMNKLTEEQKAKITIDYDCYGVRVELGALNEPDYITAIYYNPDNPDNIGERMNIVELTEFLND